MNAFEANFREREGGWKTYRVLSNHLDGNIFLLVLVSQVLTVLLISAATPNECHESVFKFVCGAHSFRRGNFTNFIKSVPHLLIFKCYFWCHILISNPSEGPFSLKGLKIL